MKIEDIINIVKETYYKNITLRGQDAKIEGVDKWFVELREKLKIFKNEQK